MEGPKTFCSHVRKFINASYCIYTDVRDTKGDVNVSDLSVLVLQHSRSFRDELKVLCDDISAVAKASDSHETEEGNAWDEEFDFVFRIEKTWHICEILLLNPNANLSIDMLRWLKETTVIDSFENTFEAFYHMSEPEQCDGVKSNNLNYWGSVLQMFMSGEISLAVAMLKLHSEIAAAFDSRLSRRQFRVDEHDIDPSHCYELFETIEAHPYATGGGAVADDDGVSPSVSSSSGGASLSLGDWHAQLRALRGSGSSVLGRLPELDTVFRILLGETSTLSEFCEGDWKRLALAQLYYKYPAPLSRSNLLRIVEDCMKSTNSSTSRRRGVSDVISLDLLQEAMRGNAGPILRDIIQQGTEYREKDRAEEEGAMIDDASGAEEEERFETVNSALALTAELCAAHLTSVLALSPAYGAGKQALTITVFPNSKHQTSFREELCLEVANSLHNFDASIELVQGYLDPSICPKQGSERARYLLNDRAEKYVNMSDTDLMEITDALEQWGWVDDAKRVLVNRALLWLARGNSDSYPQYNDDTIAAAKEQQQEQQQQGTKHKRSTLAKVVFFLQMGEDWCRLHLLLDHLLHRCAMSAARCNVLFGDLNFLPAPALEPYTFLISSTTTTSAAAEGGKTTGAGAEAAADDNNKEVLRTSRYDLAEYCKRFVVEQSSEDSIISLESVLHEAQEVLQTVASDRFLNIDTVNASAEGRVAAVEQYQNQEEKEVGVIVNALYTYVKGIRLLLGFKAEQAAKATNAPSSFAGITVAAELLASLVIDKQGDCFANMRFWMHLVEMCALCCKTITSAESLSGESINKWTSASTKVFPSDTVFKLLGAVEEVLSSYASPRLYICLHMNAVANSTSNVNSNGGSSSSSSKKALPICSELIDQEEPLRALRVNLLHMLSGSLVQKNADIGLRKEALHNEEYNSTSLAAKIIASAAQKQHHYGYGGSASISTAFATSLPRARDVTSGAGAATDMIGVDREDPFARLRRRSPTGNDAYEFLTGSRDF